MDGVGTTEFTVALESVITYMLVMVMRKVAPDFWAGLGGRFKRMLSVAVASTLVAVVGGLMSGQGWGEIGGSALAAFAGSVALRQATKRKVSIPDTPEQKEAKGQELGYRSKMPNVIPRKDK